MIGVLVNTITVILGSCIGLLLKKGIPDRLSRAVMLGIGLCSVYIGVDGALQGENTLVLIVSMVLGAMVGTALDLDGKIQALGELFERKFQRAPAPEEESDSRVSLAQGFVTASLLFCVGSMTIMGSLEAGLHGDYRIILAKSALDFVSSMAFGAAMGIGVTFSALFVLVFQGALTLLASLVGPYLSTRWWRRCPPWGASSSWAWR